MKLGADQARGDVVDANSVRGELLGPRLFYLGSSASGFTCLVALDPATGSREVLRPSRKRCIDPAYVSIPEAIGFPTDGGLTAHAFYYRPVNRDYTAAPGERPPLIVANHGRPTRATAPALNLSTQFWTSCGFALVDVNYGGSTGFGRAYRQRLNGQWGVVNLADCANAARYFVDRDEVDCRRIAVYGGSAGGYTALCALIFSDLFAACAAHYGIADLEIWATETYKFEAHMADILSDRTRRCVIAIGHVYRFTSSTTRLVPRSSCKDSKTGSALPRRPRAWAQRCAPKAYRLPMSHLRASSTATGVPRISGAHSTPNCPSTVASSVSSLPTPSSRS